MATRFSNALVCSTDTDAHFRTFVQFVEDTIVTTGGWLVTSDTGQTLPSLMTHPASSGIYSGYRIYTMNDALQATYPVFMRIDYGASPPSAAPALKVTIGMGSDGVGNITTKLLNNEIVSNAAGNFSDNSTVTNSYGSANTNRLALALCVHPTSNASLVVFTIARTKDSLGNDTGNGLLLIYHIGSNPNGAVNYGRYLRYGVGIQPGGESGLHYALTTQNPSQTLGGDIGVGIPMHFQGVAQQPGVNVVIVNSLDVAAEGTFSLTLYGIIRTYVQVRSPVLMALIGSSSTVDSLARCCIRYD